MHQICMQCIVLCQTEIQKKKKKITQFKNPSTYSLSTLSFHVIYLCLFRKNKAVTMSWASQENINEYWWFWKRITLTQFCISYLSFYIFLFSSPKWMGKEKYTTSQCKDFYFGFPFNLVLLCIHVINTLSRVISLL